MNNKKRKEESIAKNILFKKVIEKVKKENENWKLNQDIMKSVFKHIFKTMKETLIDEEKCQKIHVENFGTFNLKTLKARKIEVAKKPTMKKGVATSSLPAKDKKTIFIPERISLSFKPSKNIKKIK